MAEAPTASLPRLVIAGTASHVGKTTVTAGLIAALRARGLRVQPFKAGPDYIDPTYHALAAGRPARSLDTWLLTHDQARGVFDRGVIGADVAIVEGVMGLYDGAGYDAEAGSTAELAKLLDAPVVLVVDVAAAARSVAATVLGFQHFDPAAPLAGVILNRAGSERHAAGVAGAIEAATGLPVLGALPRSAEVAIPERHLGLLPGGEHGAAAELIARLAALVERHCDVARLLALAATAPALIPADGGGPTPAGGQVARGGVAPATAGAGRRPTAAGPVIAVARDAAFSFYYEDNLDLLRAAGARLAFFSPRRDAAVPPGAAGLYLGGGFPEVYAADLAANAALRAAIRAAVESGLPCYAECGGLMYLTRALIDQAGMRHPMVGLLPGAVSMAGGRRRLGYAEVEARRDTLLLRAGEAMRGHEFHYSAWDHAPDAATTAYTVAARRDDAARAEGYAHGNLLASYIHLHFAARPAVAERFVAACAAARAAT